VNQAGSSQIRKKDGNRTEFESATLFLAYKNLLVASAWNSIPKKVCPLTARTSRGIRCQLFRRKQEQLSGTARRIALFPGERPPRTPLPITAARRGLLIARRMVAVHVAIERVPCAQKPAAHLAIVAGWRGQVERLHMVAGPRAVAAMFAAHGADIAASQRILHQHRLQVRFERLAVHSHSR
jgi:hypothetical protein